MVSLCAWLPPALLFAEPPGTSPPETIPTPRPAQLAWQQAELGMLVCYELHTFNAGRYRQGNARVTPIEDVNQFNPTALDTDQWIRAVRDGGGRFAILTASHESGFRLWQSDANPYCLKAVRWGDGKRDIVAEFVASCRKYDVKPGIYLGTRWNAQLGVYDFKVTARSTITQEAYNRLIEREVEEICTRYGELFEIWFDGGAYGPKDGGPDVLSVVEEHQPQALFYHNYQRADARWGGSESGTVPYPCWATMPFDGYEGHKKESHANGFRLLKYGDPEGKVWCPAMSDAPLRGFRGHQWFWEPGDDRLIYPLERLVAMYERSVGRNSTLILGITPDTRGLLPQADVDRLAEFAAAVRRRYDTPAGTTTGEGNELTLQLATPATLDRIMLQEDIRQGERVREFRVDAMIDTAWQEIATGSCIGHKAILPIEPTATSKLRLVITKSIAEPRIRTFSAFAPEETTPATSFAIGADISWVQQQEDAGVRFADNGTRIDVLRILNDHGFNWIRLRVFHNPKAEKGYSAEGYCDLSHTLAMAKRVKAAGIRLLLDFHYSDTWADPAHQTKPAAWTDLHGEELNEAVYDHTREVVAALKKQSTLPDVVQIGNEISNGMLWPDGKMWASDDWDVFCGLIKAGCDGVKDVDPNVKIMLHLAWGGQNAKSRAFLDRVSARGVPFDVIGQSYYPRWHGTLDDLESNLTDLAGRYEQEIMLVEYSVPDVRQINDIVRELPGGKGLGTFIWEPTRWQGGALFDQRGNTRPEIDVYAKMAEDYRRQD